MKALSIFAPVLMVLFFVSGVAFGAFGDVTASFELGIEDSSYGLLSPTSLCFGDSHLWILEAKRIKYGDEQYFLTFYEYEIVTHNGAALNIVKCYDIAYGRSDMNGFCYVTENDDKYIWTTLTQPKVLYQLDLSTYYTNGDGGVIQPYKSLYLPENYYPTGITLDNNLNIYFIDGIDRKIYKINYAVYQSGPPGIYLDEDDISEVFVVPKGPSIPMGIEYIGGLPEKFYITLAGEHDYIIKVGINGFLYDWVELSDPEDPEETTSYMPTDLTVDDQGYIWFTDDDWDILYKVEGSDQ